MLGDVEGRPSTVADPVQLGTTIEEVLRRLALPPMARLPKTLSHIIRSRWCGVIEVFFNARDQA
jgi:hypothetical protein